MPAKSPDIATLAALGAVNYTASALAHEGLGHGGACVALGGRVVALTSTYLRCSDGLTAGASQALMAAGTLTNLVLAFFAFLLLRTVKSLTPWARAFWWLFATVNGLQGGGYLMVSPLGRFGDWHFFIGEAPTQWEWPLRLGLTMTGMLVSFWVAATSAKIVVGLIGDDERRLTRLKRLVWVPYVSGCSIDLFAGVFNPLGWRIVLASSVGSAVFGTCWLVFVIPSIARRRPPEIFSPCEFSRSAVLIVGALVISVVHVWFGRGYQALGQ